jgi:hypothetical protein
VGQASADTSLDKARDDKRACSFRHWPGIWVYCGAQRKLQFDQKCHQSGARAQGSRARSVGRAICLTGKQR